MPTHPEKWPLFVVLLASTCGFAQELEKNASHSMRSSGERYHFSEVSRWQDDLGLTHLRMEQLYNGVRVLGGETILHQPTGALFTKEVSEEAYSKIDVSTVPALGPKEALAIASHDMGIQGRIAYEPSVELVLKPRVKRVVRSEKRGVPEEALNAADVESKTIGHRLVYQVNLITENRFDGFREVLYQIDAHSGRIMKRQDNLRSEAVKGLGNSQYSGPVSLDTRRVGDHFELRDMTRGEGGNFTLDLANGGHASTAKGPIFVDADNTWGDGKNYSGSESHSPNGQTAAVDAHYGLQVAWDMYLNVFGRNGIDGKGTATFSRVHAGRNYINAFWSDACFCMTYGDGQVSKGFSVLTSLDVVAHEMSHGVCSHSAKLVYSGESGGLNEANSDIMGTMAEFYSKGGGFASRAKTIPEQGGNFEIGEAVKKNPLRYMHKPSKDGKSPDAWTPQLAKMDVHFSCGPANRMFFFLSQGAGLEGENSSRYLAKGMSGIGNDKAAKIWYRAMTIYMKSDCDYQGAREACLRAAADLYGKGQAEEAAVAEAFAGINVGSSR